MVDCKGNLTISLLLGRKKKKRTTSGSKKRSLKVKTSKRIGTALNWQHLHECPRCRGGDLKKRKKKNKTALILKSPFS